jgi:hypothetical protein
MVVEEKNRVKAKICKAFGAGWKKKYHRPCRLQKVSGVYCLGNR